jgi:hypothetical protein
MNNITRENNQVKKANGPDPIGTQSSRVTVISLRTAALLQLAEYAVSYPHSHGWLPAIDLLLRREEVRG